MMKRLFSFLLMICPILVFADDTVSFTPPTSDYSVGWLADIFGIVDGVLHGTGSQIVGSMFSVFNAAVMALGGIIISYTMLVSTMNTAHEGEMLGKKWSSIWVPVRATAGFALLVPKASGYCLLQVFVMWVVVQGVGAADKLWSEALGYLNRGGVIIQSQQDPTASMIGGTASDQLTDGAITMLSGQVCMLAIEKLLKNKYAEYKNSNGAAGSGKCSENLGGNDALRDFCAAGPVPSFSDTLDFKTENDKQSTAGSSSASLWMPNFDTSSIFYNQLNGICGTIKWNLMDSSSIATLGNAGLTPDELQIAKDARVIAIQQMYSDLMMVAQVMVNNDPDPALSSSTATASPSPANSPPPSLMQAAQNVSAANAANVGSTQHLAWATESFGEPLESDNTPCQYSGDANCTNWGTPNGGGALLNGTELVGSVLDYNGVIKPTLTLLAQPSGAGNSAKQFIQGANASGWIMAGSYFFQLIALNNQNVATSQSISSDANSGLNTSLFSRSNIGQEFPLSPASNGYAQCGNATLPSASLCKLLDGDTSQLNPIYSLFTGQAVSGTNSIIVPNMDKLKSISNLKTGPGATIPAITTTSPPNAGAPQSPTSVFGYLQNALVIQVPGQPANPPLQFANMMHANFNGTSFKMPPANFSCMGIDLLFVEFCIGRMIGNIIYNDIILMVLNTITAWLESWIYGLVMNMLMIPLDAMAAIFTQGIKILDVPGINPIVALAQMGTYYINFVGKLWFMVLVNQIIEYVWSIVGIVLLPIALMAMPITIAWSMIMVGVGFITAYYVPLVPYMIFLFGSIAWFMSVIEAMVAAPIVALGVIHPEGHDIFGKGEAAIMILMNVFLRPAMMIIGFITAISLCYVGIWVLNAGFDRAIGFMQQGQSTCNEGSEAGAIIDDAGAAALTAPEGAVQVGAAAAAAAVSGAKGTGVYGKGSTGLGCVSRTGQSAGEAAKSRWDQDYASPVPGAGVVSGGYTQWAGVFAFLFSILIYTTIYMTLVEKSFTLISSLPDNILRWIGGQQERHGQEAAQWASDTKTKVGEASKESDKAMLQAGEAAAKGAPTGSKGSMGIEEK